MNQAVNATRNATQPKKSINKIRRKCNSTNFFNRVIAIALIFEIGLFFLSQKHQFSDTNLWAVLKEQ
jgi:hypothetical protein